MTEPISPQTTQGRFWHKLAALSALIAVSIIGHAAAADTPAGAGGWTLYSRYHNGQAEIVRGLSQAFCEAVKDATLKQPGPRGPSGMPIVGHISPTEIETIECLPAEAAPTS